MASPHAHEGTAGKVLPRTLAIELACTALHEMYETSTQQTANTAPRNFASHFHRSPIPRVNMYITPPRQIPRSSFSRKCIARSISEYLVAIPVIAAIHIQKIAPGPPETSAADTPTTLPLPTHDERAVASAWKGLSSPSPVSLFRRFPNTSFTAVPNFLNCTPLVTIVIRIPVPKKMASITGPNRNPVPALKKLSKV